MKDRGVLKSIFVITSLMSCLYGSENSYAVSNKHSFALPKNSFEIKASYLKVNDTIDVLNLKEKKFKSLGSIGDMDGYSLALRYGLSNKDSIFVSGQRWNVDYGDSTLKNNKINLFNRYLLLHNPDAFFNNLSIDVGFSQDSANDIVISNDRSLNALIKKIKPDGTNHFNDGSIVSGDTTITLYDKNGNKIYPHISIGDLSDRSYYARLLVGKTFSKDSILDFYIGCKYTTITTKISFYPNNSFINGLIKNYKFPNMNRNEKNINVGFSYLLQKYGFVGELNYEYNRMLRDSDVSYLDYNHIFNASLGRKIGKNTLIYIGGRLMMEQFNSDIPYLYNRYTKTQFDHKYGFAKIGLIYKFK